MQTFAKIEFIVYDYEGGCTSVRGFQFKLNKFKNG